MSQQKVTDEQWAEARKRYETEPGMGLGKIAQVLDCSKSLVARKAREGRWQKDVGVPGKVHKGASPSDSKLTQNAVHSATLSPGVHGVTDQTSGQVGDVYRMPALAAPTPAAGGPVGMLPTPPHESTAFKIAEPPADLGIIERLDWVRREFNVLEQKMGDRHETERRALQSEFAIEMTKGVRTDRGPSLRLKALTEALAARQEMQKAALEEYRESRLKEYAGVYSSDLVIVAVEVPGFSILKSNGVFEIARRTRQVAEFYVAVAAKAEAEADAEDANWRDLPVKPEEPLTVDVEATEVTGEVSGAVYAPREEVSNA